MTLFFLQLTQTVTGAVITIVALLLVAVIIGYFTAWLYARSVYTPVIKGLETDKAGLIKQVAGLNDDINKLTGEIEKLNDKIGKLEEELIKKDNEIEKLNKPKKQAE